MSEARDRVERLMRTLMEEYERKLELLRQYFADGSPQGITPPSEGPPATEAPKRPAKASTDTADRVAVVLQKEGALKIMDLVNAMKAAGWTTRGKNKKASIYNAIKNDDRFQQPKRGTWEFVK